MDYSGVVKPIPSDDVIPSQQSTGSRVHTKHSSGSASERQSLDSCKGPLGADSEAAAYSAAAPAKPADDPERSSLSFRSRLSLILDQRKFICASQPSQPLQSS